MRLRKLVFLALVGLALPGGSFAAAPRHKPTHRHPATLRLPADYAAWTQVATCEEGGWTAAQSWYVKASDGHLVLQGYPDALGITAANYLAFGGKPDPPGPLTLKQRVAEIRVADRLIHHYGIEIPDQGGCHGSW